MTFYLIYYALLKVDMEKIHSMKIYSAERYKKMFMVLFM